MRFRLVVADRESLRLIEEARELASSVQRLMQSFERSVRSGQLEAELERLADVLERLVLHGVSYAETALERARLLASYAHALRVRLSSRMATAQPYLGREYNDFSRHLAYIRETLENLYAIVSSALGGSRSGASGGGRSPSRPAV